MAFNGNTFLFVGTKKQAQDAIKESAEACGQHYVNHRWLGGMLTNWNTIQTRIDRLNQLDKMAEDGTLEKLPKKEQARLQEERDKLQQVLGGIRTLSGLPDCMFVVDCKKEHIALREARRLEVPIVAVVDTNCDPDEVDHVIPGNDDAIRAVKLMAAQMAEAINEGRLMAQSAMEQRADAAMHGAVGGAVHVGEGGRIEYVGAPTMELPPVDIGDDGDLTDEAMLGGPATNGAAPLAELALASANGAAGDTSDPESATQRSGDTIEANGGSGRVTIEEIEASSNAVGPDAPQIHTSEAAPELRSERSDEAQTPAEGTLG